MSYFPPPYSPPPFGPADAQYFMPPREASVPARKAGVAMFVVAGLMLVVSCMFFMISTVPVDQLPPETRDQFEKLAAPSGFSAHQLFVFAGLVVFLPGAALAALAPFVRRGSKTASAMSVVVASLLLFFFAANGLVGLARPSAVNVAGILVFLAVTALLVAMMVWLVGSLRAGPGGDALAAQYQAQYWQYVQQQQAYYQNSGYGYSAPPVQQQPPAPAANPPALAEAPPPNGPPPA